MLFLLFTVGAVSLAALEVAAAAAVVVEVVSPLGGRDRVGMTGLLGDRAEPELTLLEAVLAAEVAA